MANQEHLAILEQGVDVWNKWREEHPHINPDLSNADLSGADLRGVDLHWANLFDTELEKADLSGADLSGAILDSTTLYYANLSYASLNGAQFGGANLSGANLNGADLSGADLSYTDLFGTDLSDANLSNVNLDEANLSGANLNGADLSGANLSSVTLIRTNLTNATLKDCNIYGISVWDIQLNGAEQLNLTITPEDQPTITVDNLKIAQFIYLFLDNREIRDAIDTIAKKAVLILGRFTPDRKAVLDALRKELRKKNYLPILFDFEKPSSRDFTETVSILAHLSRFVIVDLTSPNSVPYELGTLVNQCIVPFQPILLKKQHEFPMLQDLRRRHHWFLPTHTYRELEDLLVSLEVNVIEPAEQKAKELEKP